MPETFEGSIPPPEQGEEETTIERDRRICGEVESDLLLVSEAVLSALGIKQLTAVAAMEYYIAALDPENTNTDTDSVTIRGKSYPTSPIRQAAARSMERILKQEGLFERSGYGDPERSRSLGSKVTLGNGENSIEINPSFDNTPNRVFSVDRISRGTAESGGNDQISVTLKEK